MDWTNSRNRCKKILFQNTKGAAVGDVNCFELVPVVNCYINCLLSVFKWLLHQL
jgi:hypothetical protein